MKHILAGISCSLLLSACASTYNIGAVRSLPSPASLTQHDREECELRAMAEGKKYVPSHAMRTVANIGIWPVPELVIAHQRDSAARAAYRACLKDKGYPTAP